MSNHDSSRGCVSRSVGPSVCFLVRCFVSPLFRQSVIFVLQKILFEIWCHSIRKSWETTPARNATLPRRHLWRGWSKRWRWTGRRRMRWRRRGQNWGEANPEFWRRRDKNPESCASDTRPRLGPRWTATAQDALEGCRSSPKWPRPPEYKATGECPIFMLTIWHPYCVRRCSIWKDL